MTDELYSLFFIITSFADIIFKTDDQSGGTTTYFSLDGSEATYTASATTAIVIAILFLRRKK